MKYVTPRKMREIDRLTQTRYGIPALVLMENAGRVAAEEVTNHYGNKKIRIAVFCGKGNNGGDGFVCARYLHNKRSYVAVFILGRAEDIKSKESLLNLDILRRMGIKITQIPDKAALKKIKNRFNYDLIIDALFGTGFGGRMTPLAAGLISFLNKNPSPIFSIDIPSGLDAATGKPSTPCLKAKKTITMGLPKKGFLTEEGRKFSGRVIVRDIGIPRMLTG